MQLLKMKGSAIPSREFAYRIESQVVIVKVLSSNLRNKEAAGMFAFECMVWSIYNCELSMGRMRSFGEYYVRFDRMYRR